MSEKKNIRRITNEELDQFLSEKGEKKFRRKQIIEWLWQKHVSDFDEMTSLSLQLRTILSEEFYISRAKVSNTQVSKDKTIKVAFKLEENSIVEGVLIPSGDRMTACISSQVGCHLGCKFCATAGLGFRRNLFPDEIVDQVVELDRIAKENYQESLSNIVYMGMGEPLMNLSNVADSVRWLTSEQGLGISHKRITLSTVGLAGQIKKLADEDLKINLALSLHIANNEKRNKIAPINRSNPIQDLIESVKYFYEKTGIRITIEYILFKGFNDSLEDASELAAFCKHFPVKVNIIEYNPVERSFLERADDEDMERFVTFLRDKINIIVNVRRSRGKDIDAACGQLANKLADKK
ncbi:MAG: 23S rRNA (adenine(2503)-C(2))-methyltransferase RlmN [Bacteroidales bacterium]|nr:23S rRNA (adenine(2503)-C(2))-methyltransferase RlmN [Bacteroidales bacterium]